MATTRLYAPRPYDSIDFGIAGVAPILPTGTDVDNTKLAAVQAAAVAGGYGTLLTSAGGTAPTPVAEPLRFRGAWQANTDYSYGDAVNQAGVLYVAPMSFRSGSSFVAANWSRLGIYDATDPALSAAYESPGAIIGSGETLAGMQAKINSAGVGATVYFGGSDALDAALTPLDKQRWYGPGTLTASGTNTTEVVDITGKTGVIIDVAVDGGMATVLTGNPGPGLVNVCDGIRLTGSIKCKVSGRIQNVPGNAVRLYDSSFNEVRPDIYNCYYGVIGTSGGSVGDSGGGSHFNKIIGGWIDTIGKNAVYFTGHSDSTALPNPQYSNEVVGTTIYRFGDTGIEIGQGSHNFVVSGVTIDGGDTVARLNGWAFNGILIRDGSGHSISAFTIKNIPSFTNGNGAYLSLGNGVFFWPQYTGAITGVTVNAFEIENCSRGVFAQGNNTTFDTTSNIAGGAGTVTFTDGATTNASTAFTSTAANFISSDAGKTITGAGIPAATTIASVTNGTTVVLSAAATATATGVTFGIFGRQVYAGNVISNGVVDGTQLGVLDGSYSGFLNALQAHGYYIQSVSGFELSSLTAKNCQNDGFRIGDSTTGSSFVIDVMVGSCIAFDNGQQNVGGQSYYGFNLFGTGNQARVRLDNCHAFDTHVSGSRTQTYGYNWNGQGSGGMTGAAAMVSCTGVGNKTGLFNNCGNASIRFGTITSTAVSYSASTTDSTVVFTGSTAAQTITLPTITTSGLGREIRIINNSSVSVTIAKTGGGTIAGPTSLAAGAEHVYLCDGTSNWY